MNEKRLIELAHDTAGIAKELREAAQASLEDYESRGFMFQWDEESIEALQAASKTAEGLADQLKAAANLIAG